MIAEREGARALRVLYDIYWWTSGPISGRVVVRELLRAWRAEFPGDEFLLGVRPRDRNAVSAAFPGVRTVRIIGRPHGLATATQYAWHAKKHAADVAFTQNFSPPGVWSAIFVHDVMFQTNPEWFTRAERAYFKGITALLPRAELVVTSSAHEAQRIREHNPRARRVEPVGLAVATALAEATPSAPEAAAGLSGFMLTVGRLNVRKNLGATLRGALSSGRLTVERPLIVVGSEDGVSAEMPPDVVDATRRGLIRFVPHVTDSELAWLYAQADLFVYMALDEGFGLPPIEALHFGTPVVASDIAVFRENLGSFATLVHPHDESGIAQAIRDCPSDRVDASAALGSWAACARRLREAIASALR